VLTGCWGSNSPNDSSVVVLGDSYASGEGTSDASGNHWIQGTGDGAFADGGTTTTKDNCHRSKNSYAVTVFKAAGFFACSGAVIGQVYNLTTADKHPWLNGTSFRSDGNLTQVDRLSGNEAKIIVSAGGNDAGFATILKACTAVGFFVTGPIIPFVGDHADPGVCAAKIKQAIKGGVSFDGFAVIKGHLIGMYQAILDHEKGNSHAHIYAVGYPLLFPPKGDRGCNGIDPVDQVSLNDATLKLDQIILNATAAFPANQVTFVDTSQVMKDHWVCPHLNGDGNWINDLQFKADPNQIPLPPIPGAHVALGPDNCSPDNVQSWKKDWKDLSIKAGPVTITLPELRFGICSQSYHPTERGSLELGNKIKECIDSPSTCHPGMTPQATTTTRDTSACQANMTQSPGPDGKLPTGSYSPSVSGMT
jgi:hypothetical protein